MFKIKRILHGTVVAMYSVGQERRLVDPPSQVVAGVRTVTTKMDGRCDPHVAAPILFVGAGCEPAFFVFHVAQASSLVSTASNREASLAVAAV